MLYTTVFLASRTEQENVIIRRKLEPLGDEFPGLKFMGLHPQGLPVADIEAMTAVVFNVPEWTRAEAAILVDLRKAGYRGPVLVAAKASAGKALKSLQAMSGVTYLEKPFETRDLMGIIRKMLTDRAVSQRIHRRFYTDQDAEIEMDGQVNRYATRLRNISRGGAYIEFLSLAKVRIGDIVRVKVELADLNRTYTMPAKVVWTSLGTLTGGTGVGVEFVGPGDVKKNVLRAY